MTAPIPPTVPLHMPAASNPAPTQTSRDGTGPDRGSPRGLGDLLRLAGDAAKGGDRVSVDDLVASVGAASSNAVLLFPALLAATPLSGIPGFTALSGLMIAVLSAQMVIGHRSLWLPRWLRTRTLGAGRTLMAVKAALPTADFIDRHTRSRLPAVMTPPGRLVLRLLCLALGLVMPFLEVIPFSGSLAAITVTCLALALLTRDGLLALIGLGFLGSVGAAVLGVVT